MGTHKYCFIGAKHVGACTETDTPLRRRPPQSPPSIAIILNSSREEEETDHLDSGGVYEDVI